MQTLRKFLFASAEASVLVKDILQAEHAPNKHYTNGYHTCCWLECIPYNRSYTESRQHNLPTEQYPD
jgi:predicted metal-dependent HD superfamily phosphohydrolase